MLFLSVLHKHLIITNQKNLNETKHSVYCVYYPSVLYFTDARSFPGGVSEHEKRLSNPSITFDLTAPDSREQRTKRSQGFITVYEELISKYSKGFVCTRAYNCDQITSNFCQDVGTRTELTLRLLHLNKLPQGRIHMPLFSILYRPE